MIEQGPAVSVIVPVYNDADGLRELVPALKQQGFDEPYEVLLVDNNSTDETPAVLEELTRTSELFSTIEYDQRQSSYAARNEGIRRSEGSILAFTDADCVPEADWLTQGVRTMRNEDVGLVAGAVRVRYDGEQPTLAECLDGSMHMNQRQYVEEGWSGAGNLFVRRSCVKQYGAFDETLVSGGDSEFGRRLTDQGVEIAYTESAVVRHPARRTLRELIQKEWRIGRGIRDLARAGRLGWKPVTPKDFLPRRPPAEVYRFGSGPSWVMKVFLAYNLVRWVNVTSRLSFWDWLGGERSENS